MKHFYIFFFAVLAGLMTAGCGVNNDNGTSHFGTWEKVDANKGVYVGLKNPAANFVSAYQISPDTTDVDTSYINRPGKIELQLHHPPSREDYIIKLTMYIHDLSFYISNSTGKYVGDSTAFTLFKAGSGMEYLGNDDYKYYLNFINNCNQTEPQKEYAVFDIWDKKDKTGIHKVFKVRIDGMKEITNDILATCKST